VIKGRGWRRKTGGASSDDRGPGAQPPIRGMTRVGADDHQGGLDTITQHLAMEYAKTAIRVNAVAPARPSRRFPEYGRMK